MTREYRMAQIKHFVAIRLLLFCFLQSIILHFATADMGEAHEQNEPQIQRFRHLRTSNSLRNEVNSRRKSLYEVKSTQQGGNLNNIGDERRLSSEEIMSMCFNDLSQSSPGNGLLTQPEYVNFLRNVTSGRVDAPAFALLPLFYVMVFYEAACVDRNCVDQPPVIPFVTNSTSEERNFVIFCHQIYDETTTTANVVFEYTIRYDPTLIDSENIPTCLGAATERLLLDSFGCSIDTRRRRLQLSTHELNTRAVKDVSALSSHSLTFGHYTGISKEELIDVSTNLSLKRFMQENDNLSLSLPRQDNDVISNMVSPPPTAVLTNTPRPTFTTASTNAPTSTVALTSAPTSRNSFTNAPTSTTTEALESSICDYEVLVTIPTFVDFECLPEVNGNDTNCGLVRSVASVAVPLFLESSQSDLRDRISSTLASAVNEDNIEDFLPSECIFV